MKKILLSILLMGFIMPFNNVLAYADSAIISGEIIPGVKGQSSTSGILNEVRLLKSEGRAIYNVTYNRLASNLYEADRYYISDYAPLTTAEIECMELAAYYGYNFEGRNTVPYYLASSQLVFECMGEYVGWFDDQGEIDISDELQNITGDIDNHYLNPSFSGTNYYLDKNETLVLEDTNGCLNNYYTWDSAQYTVEIIGNFLEVTLTEEATGSIEIPLIKSFFETGDSRILTSNQYANAADLYIKPVEYSFNIDVTESGEIPTEIPPAGKKSVLIFLGIASFVCFIIFVVGIKVKNAKS